MNPLKGKKLTNVRASEGTDEAVRLTTPITMGLEEAIAYIDERRACRGDAEGRSALRKRHLDPHEKKARRAWAAS